MALFPPSPFPAVNRHVLRAGTVLHRIHDNRFAAAAFNPGAAPYLSRFAPINDAAGTPVPTLYAATTFECAAHETVFHDIVHDLPMRTVPFSRLQRAQHSILRLAENAVMAALFEPDLNAWGLSRRDLIDTLPDQYRRTARWAEAIHAAAPDIQGLVWTSRRADPELCLFFFGDRAGPSVLQAASTVPLAGDNAELQQIIAFARRAGIVITL